MNNMHGLIFAYEAEKQLKELVEHRTSSSIPFGGRYRLIDFLLSSMVNAGISDIGIMMHRGYQSLLDHLGAGRDWSLDRRVGGLKLLPPFGYSDTSVSSFRSWMEALKSNYVYLRRIRQKYVVLGRGDVVVNLPLEEVLKQHVDTGVDVTAVCIREPRLPLQSSTFFLPAADGTMKDLITDPISRPEGSQSLDIYVLSKELLLQIVEYGNARNLMRRGDFLRLATQGRRTGLYAYDGYVAAITSVEEYFKRSMELLSSDAQARLFFPGRTIKTKERSDVSSYYGSDAKSKNCLVADGCYIEGEIENCVLFRGVRVGKDSVVKNCVLMQDTVIGEQTSLSYLITDKNVTVNPYATLAGHQTYPITIGKNAVV